MMFNRVPSGLSEGVCEGFRFLQGVLSVLDALSEGFRLRDSVVRLMV